MVTVISFELYVVDPTVNAALNLPIYPSDEELAFHLILTPQIVPVPSTTVPLVGIQVTP